LQLITGKEPVILVGSDLPNKSWRAMDWSPTNLNSDAVLGVKKSHKSKLTIGCCKLEPVPVKDFFNVVASSKEQGSPGFSPLNRFFA
jgi:hypothetical protein